jgi:hypothetical protein
MRCYEHSNLTYENINFIIILVCLFPCHHVLRNNFGGNSAYSKKAFYIQKERIIRIMVDAEKRAPCRELFKKFIILLATEFLLSLSSFVVDNMEHFKRIQMSTV